MRTTTILTLAAAGVLAIAGCGGGSAPATAGGSAAAPSTPAATTSDAAPSSAPAASAGGEAQEVAIQGFAFVPADLSVPAGTTVTWTNNDAAPHTVKWSDATPESEQMDQGGTYERTFDAAGTFDYVCGIHPNMTASVTVTE